MLNVNIQITSYEQGERLLRAVFAADTIATAPEVLGGAPEKKSEKKAAKAAEPAKTAEPAAEKIAAPKEQPGEAPLTLEVVRGRAQELSIAGKKAQLKKILTENFGVEKVAELAKDQYADFYAQMAAL